MKGANYGDGETGLIYMRARYYDPSIGRFISEDPAKDGLNWYTYSSNDPVNKLDPDGNSQTGTLVVDFVALIGASATMVDCCNESYQFGVLCKSWALWIGLSAIEFITGGLGNAFIPHAFAAVTAAVGFAIGSGRSMSTSSPLGVGDFYKGYGALIVETYILLSS